MSLWLHVSQSTLSSFHLSILHVSSPEFLHRTLCRDHVTFLNASCLCMFAHSANKMSLRHPFFHFCSHLHTFCHQTRFQSLFLPFYQSETPLHKIYSYQRSSTCLSLEIDRRWNHLRNRIRPPTWSILSPTFCPWRIVLHMWHMFFLVCPMFRFLHRVADHRPNNPHI